MAAQNKKNQPILWFSEIGKENIPLVGGKGANLGEMTKEGIPVPNGFATNANEYYKFVNQGSLKEKIKQELHNLNIEDNKALQQAAKNIRTLVIASELPASTRKTVKNAYAKLSKGPGKKVAVRSSATAEDLPEASFAGQQKTILNVQDYEELKESILESWASLFTARAIFYREEHGFEHMKVGISTIVQLMIQSDVSGVAFTVDPLTSDSSKISIEAVYGLGETIVGGSITPDQYLVNKESMKIESKQIVKQTWQLTEEGEMPISEMFQEKQKLSDKKVVKLAEICKKIEQHYEFPQDIEWGMEDNKLWIVQTRPVTTLKIADDKVHISEKEVNKELLLKGIGASPGAAIGKVSIIESAKELDKVKKGDILVTTMTNPDFVPAMKRAAAIVTDQGGRTSHAAIVSRELGIPCIVGTELATESVKDGEEITVDGYKGRVYEGKLSLEKISPTEAIKQRHDPEAVHNLHTATKVYVNLGEPSVAKKLSKRNVDGIGLLRAEFMIAEIGTHPRKIIHDGKEEDYINKLAHGLKQFVENFAPRPVVYRTSDFKTNEYRHLEGGEKYEGEESNPLIGFRGAARYLENSAVFNLEMEAIKKVRNKMNFKNLHIMIPFVRTPEELRKVKKLVAAAGLQRSANFKLWMMVEIPSNVLILEDFLKVGIDGVSIGSNDLTMLTLGVDRDNAKLAEDFDETDKAVVKSLKKVIEICKKEGVTSSICGQAASDYPELVKKMVKWGVTSVSVNPDRIEKTRQLVYEAEKQLIKQDNQT